jgi:hypothetical protein
LLRECGNKVSDEARKCPHCDCSGPSGEYSYRNEGRDRIYVNEKASHTTVIKYGRINAVTPGSYTVEVCSDDASILQIDGATLTSMNNMQNTTCATAQVTLTAGFHDFRLVYIQLPRLKVALQILWRVPGSGSFVPVSLFSPASKPTCTPLY